MKPLGMPINTAPFAIHGAPGFEIQLTCNRGFLEKELLPVVLPQLGTISVPVHPGNFGALDNWKVKIIVKPVATNQP